MIELVAVGGLVMWAASDPVTVLAAVATATTLLLGAWVSLRSYQAKVKVDSVTLGLTTTDSNVKWLKEALTRADIERTQTAERHSEDLRRMQEQLDGIEARHQLDNDRCDDKLRRLGHIVKSLGGEVPDDLNGLHAA